MELIAAFSVTIREKSKITFRMRPACMQRASTSSLQNINGTCQATFEFSDCISFKCLKFGRSFSREDFSSMKKLEFCCWHNASHFPKPSLSALESDCHSSCLEQLSFYQACSYNSYRNSQNARCEAFYIYIGKRKKVNNSFFCLEEQKGNVIYDKESEEAVKSSLALFAPLLGKNR